MGRLRLAAALAVATGLAVPAAAPAAWPPPSTRLTSFGPPGDVSYDATRPRLALEPDGGGLVAWMGARCCFSDTGSDGTYVQRIDASGRPTGPVGRVTTAARAPSALVRVGDRFYLAWAWLGDAAVLPLDPDGNPLAEPAPVPKQLADATVTSIAAAATANGLMLAWTESRRPDRGPNDPRHGEVFVAAADDLGRVTGAVHQISDTKLIDPGFRYTTSTLDGVQLVLAPSGDGLLVGWRVGIGFPSGAGDGSRRRLVVRRLGLDGTPRGLMELAGDSASGDLVSPPLLVADPPRNGFLALIDDAYGRLSSRLLDADGVPVAPAARRVALGTDGLRAAEGAWDPALGTFVIALHQFYVNHSSALDVPAGEDQVLLQRLDADGAALAPPVRLSVPGRPPATREAGPPSMAFTVDGHSALLAWDDSFAAADRTAGAEPEYDTEQEITTTFVSALDALPALARPRLRIVRRSGRLVVQGSGWWTSSGCDPRVALSGARGFVRLPRLDAGGAFIARLPIRPRPPAHSRVRAEQRCPSLDNPAIKQVVRRSAVVPR